DPPGREQRARRGEHALPAPASRPPGPSALHAAEYTRAFTRVQGVCYGRNCKRQRVLDRGGFTMSSPAQSENAPSDAWPPRDHAVYATQLYRGSRSTRAFRPTPVPETTLRAVFDLAAAAPSNSNAQPWQVEVVSGARRDELADALVAANRAGKMS